LFFYSLFPIPYSLVPGPWSLSYSLLLRLDEVMGDGEEG
jgi:hypothetical protein